jgi:hypothetical protein
MDIGLSQQNEAAAANGTGKPSLALVNTGICSTAPMSRHCAPNACLPHLGLGPATATCNSELPTAGRIVTFRQQVEQQHWAYWPHRRGTKLVRADMQESSSRSVVSRSGVQSPAMAGRCLHTLTLQSQSEACMRGCAPSAMHKHQGIAVLTCSHWVQLSPVAALTAFS